MKSLTLSLLLAGLATGALAQTVTGTNGAEVRTYTETGQSTGARPAADVIGRRVATPLNSKGLVGVETSSGIVFLRGSALQTSAPLPGAPSGCLAMGTQRRDGRGTTNGLGDC